LKQVSERFEGIDTRIQRQGERVSNAEQRTHEASGRFSDVEARFERIAERLDGFETRHAYARRRMDAIETLLELANHDPEALWLFANREERMDATVPLFNEDRRSFHLARYAFAQSHATGDW